MKINLLILCALLVAQNLSAGAGLPFEAVLYGGEGEANLVPYGASAAGGSTSGVAVDNIILRRYQSAPNVPAVSAVRQLDCRTIGFSGEVRFTVYVLGSVKKDDVCSALTRAERELKHNPTAARTFSDKDLGLYFRTAKAWYLITFDQRIRVDAERGTDLEADLPAYDPKFEDRWAISQHGALVHYTKGNVEIYAPGEAIHTDTGLVTVKAVMTEDDVFGLNEGQSLKKIATALRESSSLSVAEAIELARKEGAEVTVPELSKMRPRDPATWQARLGALLPDVGAGMGEGRVSAVRFDEAPRDVRGYQGAAKVSFADGRDVMVFLLDAPRRFEVNGGSASMAWFTVQLQTLMAFANEPGRISSGEDAGLDGAALTCQRTTTVPGTVEVVCGIADPDLPIILATRYSYSGIEEAPPETLRQAAIDRMILVRRLIEEATE